MPSTSQGVTPRPSPGLHPWTPLEDFRTHTPNLPTPEKHPAGAHVNTDSNDMIWHVLPTSRDGTDTSILLTLTDETLFYLSSSLRASYISFGAHPLRTASVTERNHHYESTMRLHQRLTGHWPSFRLHHHGYYASPLSDH